MFGDTNSHAQHCMDAWKKIVDKTVENMEMLHRVSTESSELVREMVDAQEHFGDWNEQMNRQLEVVVGLSKSVTDQQGELSNLSRTALDNAAKINRAWNEVVMDTAKRAAGWMPSSS